MELNKITNVEFEVGVFPSQPCTVLAIGRFSVNGINLLINKPSDLMVLDTTNPRSMAHNIGALMLTSCIVRSDMDTTISKFYKIYGPVFTAIDRRLTELNVMSTGTPWQFAKLVLADITNGRIVPLTDSEPEDENDSEEQPQVRSTEYWKNNPPDLSKCKLTCENERLYIPLDEATTVQVAVSPDPVSREFWSSTYIITLMNRISNALQQYGVEKIDVNFFIRCYEGITAYYQVPFKLSKESLLKMLSKQLRDHEARAMLVFTTPTSLCEKSSMDNIDFKLDTTNPVDMEFKSLLDNYDLHERWTIDAAGNKVYCNLCLPPVPCYSNMTRQQFLLELGKVCELNNANIRLIDIFRALGITGPTNEGIKIIICTMKGSNNKGVIPQSLKYLIRHTYLYLEDGYAASVEDYILNIIGN